ncbi:putative ErfK/YbiS/YcfS/YnhG family protein; putative signal peptide [Bradyrhizobium sp. ORS 285]|uniref:L,D-transpeptidase family protein n=1 Tax=Bradyrhizobium sp. ORS 285 TaxID=115808 RepID=UPI000240953D|nr:L,D-transpeptidase family protein [Bradyrhizobium sp. ORS 285]CCD88132.1 putative ErfK/YbiS/YcfS/YnhG family protein; signal peptide [Bradyrhizobium sp. ORS 285]SMX58885.1 putative ErfK/YbiS/YcfS/YnhG family protein; putative signal peptide [Bradyrhizobium sp. ORS 285]
MLCVRAAARGRFFCAAIVSVPLVLAATSWADAASYYYWNDQQPVTIAPPVRPAMSPRKPKVKKTATIEKEAAKPQGPLTIAVSINKQQVKVYDANGLFAEAPVSTGMKGHSTPMGVFSVIQKQKFHRSNIYSGAPMPFMQRITWSGVALHAGVLPGYPASHGCIRMPASFAPKIYGWTRMGSRVLVTPGEVAPASFSHPMLAALKAPQPSAAVQPDASAPGTKSDKGAAVATPTITVATIDLRATIGHAEGASDISAAARPLRTADASNATGMPATTSIASPSAEQPRSNTSEAPNPAADLKPAVADTTTSEAAPTSSAAPVKAEAATSDEPKPAESETGPALASQPAPSDRGHAEATGSTDLKPDEAKPAEAKAGDAKIADQPAGPSTTTADTPAKPADANDLTKDQSRVAAPDKPIAPKPELKRNSQIAIFISRKDSKLYVRQNFAPVFNTAVTIAPSDKPLGTHVFTAATDKADPATMRWTVISLPTSARGAAANEGADKAVRRGKKVAEAHVETKPAVVLSTPSEALDRITIPADVMAWLGEALSTGSSLIVSDQGINQGETGEGTDFIVSLR